MATRESALARRSSLAAWLLVIVVTVMPLTMLWTFWPLRLFFLAVKPTMEALADRTAAGTPLGSPQWIGPFRLVGSRVVPATGNVSLMIDSNPNGPSGFVRVNPRALRRRPAEELNLDLPLGGRWWYQEED